MYVFQIFEFEFILENIFFMQCQCGCVLLSTHGVHALLENETK
jgi:hypothetical protein